MSSNDFPVGCAICSWLELLCIWIDELWDTCILHNSGQAVPAGSFHGMESTSRASVLRLQCVQVARSTLLHAGHLHVLSHRPSGHHMTTTVF